MRPERRRKQVSIAMETAPSKQEGCPFPRAASGRRTLLCRDTPRSVCCRSVGCGCWPEMICHAGERDSSTISTHGQWLHAAPIMRPLG
jgi:hypothetical protein